MSSVKVMFIKYKIPIRNVAGSRVSEIIKQAKETMSLKSQLERVDSLITIVEVWIPIRDGDGDVIIEVHNILE